jgi:hypothetical protein
MSKQEDTKRKGLRPPSGTWNTKETTPQSTNKAKLSPRITPKQETTDTESGAAFRLSKELLQTQKISSKFDFDSNEESTSLFMATFPRKSININNAAMQIYRNSVLVEKKSCENVNVGIRIRPFTGKEKEAMQIREAWERSPDGKLLDKRKEVVYGFGLSCINS